jgi:protein phosphatase
MATTVVISYMRGNKAYVVNVGDSRAYLIRDGVIRQVTDDHTWVREMVSRGMITEEEGRNHPDRNMITRAVGAEKDIKPDFFVFDVYPGDTLIMCTDGLYGEVDDQRIAELSEGASTMHKLSRQLVEEANANGGSDNISVVCIRIQ